MGINSTGPVLSYNKTPRHTAVSPHIPLRSSLLDFHLLVACRLSLPLIRLYVIQVAESLLNIYYLFHIASYPLSTKSHPQPSHFSRIGPFGGLFRGASSPLRQPRVRAGKGGGPRRFFFRYIYIQIQISNHKRNSLIHCVV